MLKRNSLLARAAHNHKLASRRGILERLFTLAFKGFVYPQIWEDPEVDLEALCVTPDSRMVTIASGGCNVLNYLTEGPAKIHAIDLNTNHVALTRLKLAAVRHLPDYETFFRFFGHADEKANTSAYDEHLAPRLDAETRAHWERRRPFFGRRINYFRKNIYEYGLLGRVITAGHWVARLHGTDPSRLLAARSLEEQKRLFDEILLPLFDRRLVNALLKLPVSLYGLGIPPAQYHALATAGGGNIAGVLRQRLERLACDFPIEDNYFAWQAFGRGYDRHCRKALPRYLDARNYDVIRAHADSVEVEQASYTDFLAARPDGSFDRYVLLDAQDWMTTEQLVALWTEIARTAAPGARIIFRTAGEHSPLEEALPNHIRERFDYDADQGRDLLKRDRSAVYGGFHLYVLR
jgi:S-adenosylmethionine-diacylglycerol 3-amino-3-carboxypropyl transferase